MVIIDVGVNINIEPDKSEFYIGTKKFTIESSSWEQICTEVISIRHKVFILEQHITQIQQLSDPDDQACHHLLVRDHQSQGIATGRITKKGRIGKIAVLLPYRGFGIGSRLLKSLVNIGKKHHLGDVSLNAELGGRHFFNLHKFSIAGPVFMKQGVPHQRLARKLA